MSNDYTSLRAIAKDFEQNRGDFAQMNNPPGAK